MKIVVSKTMLFLLVAAVHYNGQVDARRGRAPLVDDDDDKKELSNDLYCAGLTPDAGGVVDIPDDWTEVAVKAFADCQEIKSVEIPAKIIKIKEGAFLNSGLTSITFEAGSPLKEISKECFRQSHLRSILIPSSVTSVSESSFLNTHSLSSVTFEANSRLRVIGISAFSESGIITIDIPDRVTSIERMAFANNNVLEEVMFGEDSDFRKIENDAFFRCNSLKNINIPSTASISTTNPFYLAECPDLMLPGNIVVNCSVTNTLAPTTSAPITSMPTTLAPTTSAPSSSAPTDKRIQVRNTRSAPSSSAPTDKRIQNALDLGLGEYDINFMDMVFSQKPSGAFNLFLDYEVGANATGLTIGLYERGCIKKYTADAIIRVLTTDNSTVDKDILIDKRLLSVSGTALVTHDPNKGLSKGTLDFCVKTDTWVRTTSMTFHEVNLRLTYDLSVNSFAVLNNNIAKGAVSQPNPDVSTDYDAVSCTCGATKTTYDTPTSCNFDAINMSFMNSKFAAYPTQGSFGASPVILGDVITFTRTIDSFPDVFKYITLLRAPFTTVNGKNTFGALEMTIFGITCVDTDQRLELPRPQLTSQQLPGQQPTVYGSCVENDQRRELPRPQLTSQQLPDQQPTVYGSLVITDLTGFVTSPTLSMNVYATVTGEFNGESVTVLHDGQLGLCYPPGYPTADNPPVPQLLGVGGVGSPTRTEKIRDLVTLEVDTSRYTVTACQCTAAAYACREDVSPTYSQNDLIHVCVQPDPTVQHEVAISNFFMEFQQGTDVVYTPVTIGNKGPTSAVNTVVQRVDSTYRVTSRLITALFGGGATSFVVAGNAYLEFRQSQRLRGRSLQDAHAGEDFFVMEVQFKKSDALANDSKSSLVLPSLTLLFISAALVILKKMKK